MRGLRADMDSAATQAAYGELTAAILSLYIKHC